jgi:hypothetical protein
VQAPRAAPQSRLPPSSATPPAVAARPRRSKRRPAGGRRKGNANGSVSRGAKAEQIRFRAPPRCKSEIVSGPAVSIRVTFLSTRVELRLHRNVRAFVSARRNRRRRRIVDFHQQVNAPNRLTLRSVRRILHRLERFLAWSAQGGDVIAQLKPLDSLPVSSGQARRMGPPCAGPRRAPLQRRAASASQRNCVLNATATSG